MFKVNINGTRERLTAVLNVNFGHFTPFSSVSAATLNRKTFAWFHPINLQTLKQLTVEITDRSTKIIVK